MELGAQLVLELGLDLVALPLVLPQELVCEGALHFDVCEGADLVVFIKELVLAVIIVNELIDLSLLVAFIFKFAGLLADQFVKIADFEFFVGHSEFKFVNCNEI